MCDKFISVFHSKEYNIRDDRDNNAIQIQTINVNIFNVKRTSDR